MRKPDKPVDIMDNYRPIGIRAVNAALVVRPRVEPLPEPSEMIHSGAPLPEGFHMPPSVLDD